MPVLGYGARVLPLQLVPVPGHGAQISAQDQQKAVFRLGTKSDQGLSLGRKLLCNPPQESSVPRSKTTETQQRSLSFFYFSLISFQYASLLLISVEYKDKTDTPLAEARRFISGRRRPTARKQSAYEIKSTAVLPYIEGVSEAFRLCLQQSGLGRTCYQHFVRLLHRG